MSYTFEFIQNLSISIFNIEFYGTIFHTVSLQYIDLFRMTFLTHINKLDTYVRSVDWSLSN